MTKHLPSRDEAFENARDVYQIIAGIPAYRVDLKAYTNRAALQGGERLSPDEFVHHCGAIACMGGWIGEHPQYRHLVRYCGQNYASASYLPLQNHLFGIYGVGMFEPRMGHHYDLEITQHTGPTRINDKQLALHRLLRLIGYTQAAAAAKAMEEGAQ